MTEEQLRKAWAESLGKQSRIEAPESSPEPEPEPQPDLTDRERARWAAVEFQMREVMSGIDAAWSRHERAVHAAAAARLPRHQRAKSGRPPEKFDRAIAEMRRRPNASLREVAKATGVSYNTVKKARKVMRDQARASEGFTTARGSGNVSTNRECV